MGRIFIQLLTLAVLLFSYSEYSLADPWFTGPILAPPGRTIPNGHTNFEVYVFDTLTQGIFDRNWQLIRLPRSESIVVNPIFSHGYADKFDIQFSVPFVYNNARRTNTRYVGDSALTLGYQLIEQNNSRWRPNLRITLQEIIPTGRFRQLNPANNGADATGSGSYQTAFGLNLQHLAQFNEVNYLRTRISLSYVYAFPVSVEGLTSYGGTNSTSGRVWPGDLMSLDWAYEYTVTQNWVAVMETFIASRNATHFKGFIGLDPMGRMVDIGRRASINITLAPALEYNFSGNLGIIAGPWFSIAGKNTPDFLSYVVAINGFW